jgi:hypothetical protein
MVEFAIAVPLLLVIIFGMVDFGRAVDANTTVAEAARQGARQMASNAASTDTPFGSPLYSTSGTCSGTVFTKNAGGTGCLTDAAVLATVTSVLAPLTTNVTHQYGVSASSCTAPSTIGQANVCIDPSDSAAATQTGDSCSAATTRLGHFPLAGDLGGRYAEWSSPQYSSGRCFLVQVTVKYAFGPWIPAIKQVIGASIGIASSTATVAEY